MWGHRKQQRLPDQERRDTERHVEVLKRFDNLETSGQWLARAANRKAVILAAIGVAAGGIIAFVFAQGSPDVSPSQIASPVILPVAAPRVGQAKATLILNQTLRSWIDAEPGYISEVTSGTRHDMTPAEQNAGLDLRGTVVTFELNLYGPLRTEFTFHLYMFRARDNWRVPDHYVNPFSKPPARAILHGQAQPYTYATWVPAPPRPGKYYIELRVYDNARNLLGRPETRRFYAA
ncbi:MAG: hypothetical protein JWM60_1667 [Solirubrobacterales bacterium]|nr:hypothetical protein [Solirubrobacterales bacterium]